MKIAKAMIQKETKMLLLLGRRPKPQLRQKYLFTFYYVRLLHVNFANIFREGCLILLQRHVQRFNEEMNISIMKIFHKDMFKNSIVEIFYENTLGDVQILIEIFVRDIKKNHYCLLKNSKDKIHFLDIIQRLFDLI